MDFYEDKLSFTIKSEDEFYNIVDSEKFSEKDADLIYEYLKKEMKLIPFGDYLKRYIFKIAEFSGDPDEVEIDEYRSIIIESFADNATPPAFTETTSKMSALTKNWLTQTSVKRSVVFLLGFGLGMNVKDVSDFLIHGINERDFNFKNPFEVICWYCYKNGYKYPKFVQLMEEYNELPYGDGFLSSDATIGIRDLIMKVDTEEELFQKLAEIKTENNGQFYSVTAKKHFDRLYSEVRSIIAEKYNEDAMAEARRDASAYLEKIENSVSLSFEEKNVRAEKIRNSYKTVTADDITEADVEKFLCCGVPFDGMGNLFKFSSSTLAKHFSSKRMSRQHIHGILAGKIGVDRFDLITMNFFVFAMNDEYENNKTRFMKFVDDTNDMLDECYFGELYVTNPYESFVQMCILSDYPMGAYSDVLEKSYEKE